MKKSDFDMITESIWSRKGSYALNRYFFSHPSYGSLPKNMLQKMSLEARDALQDIWCNVIGMDLKWKPYEGYKTIEEFRKEYKSTMKEIGEEIEGE